MPRSKPPLTHRQVTKLKPGSGPRLVSLGGAPGLEYDTVSRGLWWRYRDDGGNRHRHKLGEFPHLKLQTARAEVHRLRELARQGRYPHRRTQPVAPPKGIPKTLEELLAWLLANHKWEDAYTPARYCQKHLLGTRVAGLPLTEIDARRDLVPLVEAAPRGARRKLIGLLRLAYRYGVDRGWVESNPITVRSKRQPVGAFVLPAQHAHTRTLDLEEVRAVIDELEAAPQRREKTAGYLAPHLAAGLLCLLYSGVRASEMLAARWRDIDLKEGVLTVRRHKMAEKTGAPKRIVLSKRVLEIIGSMPHEGEYVFRTSTGKRVSTDNASRAWNKLCSRLGINDEDTPRETKATLHSLRRTAINRALGAGLAIDVVAAMVGDSVQTVTAYYKDLVSDARARAGVEVVADLYDRSS